MDTYEVVVIGAGQAGLAAAHGLVRAGLRPGRDMLVLDSNPGPGGAWRHRWDSLTFDRAHGIADLPGLRLPRPDPRVPASRVVTDYYGEYEDRFDLDVVRPVDVEQVEEDPEDPRLLVVSGTLSSRPFAVRTRRLINATGTWTHPYVPYVPGIESFTGRVRHTVDYTSASAFAGSRVLVIGGGLSAVQFLLELRGTAETTWATRTPPNFTDVVFDQSWGRDVETSVRGRTARGLPPASVVSATGIPMLPEYLAGVADGMLVSRGMIDAVSAHTVHFPGTTVAPQAKTTRDLLVPDSWRPFDAPTDLEVDVLFFNTGFRAALDHLSPLHLRGRGGGIAMSSEVEVAADPRVLLVGYGSSASTVGATRAGRLAARTAVGSLRDAASAARAEG